MLDNRCPTPSTRGIMTDTINSKSHKISFRLSNKAYNKIMAAITNPNNSRNQFDSVDLYCKAVCERYPFRHDERKYRGTGVGTSIVHSVSLLNKESRK